jgi:hypothetical protein
MGAGAVATRGTAPRDRGTGGVFNTVPTVHAPKRTRCVAVEEVSARKTCEAYRGQAATWVRKLSVGDALCLENGVGEDTSRGCAARAAVADAGENMVLVEVREAEPTSKWFQKVQHQFWFEEGALVDLFLAERGFSPAPLK